MLVRFLRVRVLVVAAPAGEVPTAASAGGGLLEEEYLSTTCLLGRASIMFKDMQINTLVAGIVGFLYIGRDRSKKAFTNILVDQKKKKVFETMNKSNEIKKIK